MSMQISSLKRGVLVSSAGVVGSALLWLLSFKAVAGWMGPEGVGLFSQLRQVAQAATVGATFGGTNSVVQGLAEREDETERWRFRATAGHLIGLTGFAVVLVMLVATLPLTSFFLSSDAPDLVATMRWIALAVLLNVGGTYAIAVLNSYRSFLSMALAQIVGPVVMVIFLIGVWWGHVPPDPQLLAGSFVACFGVTYLVAVLGVSRLPKREAGARFGTLPTAERRAFIQFALSNLGAAMASTVALLLIRSWIIESRGLAFAGLFDAGWTLTFNYTTLLLTACSAIYLPLLTAATDRVSQKACLLKTAYLILGISLLVCYAMVLLKEPLIDILYSPEFRPSGQVVMVLVIAVVFRGVSWVYGTLILATRNSRVLLISDLALNISLLVTIRYALDRAASLELLSWAFVLPHFIYLIFVVEFARIKNPLLRRRLIWPLLMGGTLPLLYLALKFDGSSQVSPEVTKWFCIATGLAVSGTAFIAYKKLVP